MRTQVSRGICFVTMLVESEAKLAMRRLNGSEFEGNVLHAKEARPKVAKPMAFNSPRDSSHQRN